MNNEEIINDLHRDYSYKIFERDNFKCIYCGKSSIEDGVKLCIDHVDPVYSFENNKLTNLVTSCTSCNFIKRDDKLLPEVINRIIERNKKLIEKISQEEIERMEEHFQSHFKAYYCKCGRKMSGKDIKTFTYHNKYYFKYTCNRCNTVAIEEYPINGMNKYFKMDELLSFIEDNIHYVPQNMIRDYIQAAKFINLS